MRLACSQLGEKKFDAYVEKLSAIDPIKWVPKPTGPASLIEDGTRDPFNPRADVLALYRAAHGPKELRFYTADHPRMRRRPHTAPGGCYANFGERSGEGAIGCASVRECRSMTWLSTTIAGVDRRRVLAMEINTAAPAMARGEIRVAAPPRSYGVSSQTSPTGRAGTPTSSPRRSRACWLQVRSSAGKRGRGRSRRRFRVSNPLTALSGRVRRSASRRSTSMNSNSKTVRRRPDRRVVGRLARPAAPSLNDEVGAEGARLRPSAFEDRSRATSENRHHIEPG